MVYRDVSMTGGGPQLPSELRAFLFTCIESVEQLDLLLRLRASERSYTVKELSGLHELAEAVVRLHLEALVARGLVRPHAGASADLPATYAYAPKTSELRGYVDLLASHYHSSRTAVIAFVSNPSQGPLRRFSDAFKLRDSDS